MDKAIEKIILGTAQMGLTYGINNIEGKLPTNKSKNILRKAYKSGVRYLDTAEAYGDAHKIIGSFHESHPRMKFKVITKLSSTGKIKDFNSKVDHFLSELDVDIIKGLMFHSFKEYLLEKKSNTSKLKQIKEEGRINSLGVSIYTNDEFSLIIDDELIDLIQLPFNLLDNLSRRGKLLEQAKNKNKIIHTRSTFLQGVFFKSPDEDESIVKSLRSELLQIQKISKEENIPIARLALNYCIQQKYIDKVLIGVDSIHHLKLNLAALKNPLQNHLMEKIDQIRVNEENFLNPTNWK